MDCGHLCINGCAFMCVGNFSSPQGGLRRNAIFLCVCMSVYLPLHWLISKTISSNFTWFLLSAMQYVLYFWFCRYLFLPVDLSPIKGVKRTRPSGGGALWRHIAYCLTPQRMQRTCIHCHNGWWDKVCCFQLPSINQSVIYYGAPHTTL